MDYFDNYESDDLFGDNDDEFFNEILKKLAEETNMDNFIKNEKEEAIRWNYSLIKEKGIDVLEMMSYGEENFNKLKNTINEMLIFFEKTEEFEKCADLADLQKELDKVKF
tara:strand:+ start:7449 stop:7778 length:330 start_codon:yes stop_codon:yes gene_type:complete